MLLIKMEKSESPASSDSAHTPLQDENIGCEVKTPTEILTNIEMGENVDMIEEQLDYEEFVENTEISKPESEEEEGEYNSADENDILTCDDDGRISSGNNDSHSDDKSDASKKSTKEESKKKSDSECSDVEVINEDAKCEGELADGELKAEEEDIPVEETPWERGLRLARERRELAKLKKVQEKDNLKERQLHINLDNIEEVEPISKPQIESSSEINQKFLKAMQPIVILPEEPKQNEMIMEYYLAESDYQHRARFIPSRLYTLDPWEVEEWKRELDMMKMESEMERIASSKQKRLMGSKTVRSGRRGSASSSGSSRSSSESGNKAFNQTNRTYEFQTSQYALSRNKPILNKNDKSINNDPSKKIHLQRGRRDLPPEFKNRVVSSSRSSSRSSSGSHSSSSGSSSTSRSTSTPRESPKKRPNITGVTKTNQMAFRTIKKPALGRERSDSSASSKSSDSSSTSSDSSSSRSSVSSADSRKGRKSKTDKQFINSWFTKTPQNILEATKVVESVQSNTNKDNINGSNDHISSDVAAHVVAGPENMDCELPSASSRPGVKLKLVSRPKPVILPNQTSSKTPVKPTIKDKSTKKGSTTKTVPNSTESKQKTTNPSSIFSINKSIFSTVSSTTNQRISEVPPSAKESALKSNLAATQLEMQQEFLRNYKDKIAIYRSQLSYQQQNPTPGQHPGTLTHTQPPPIKGPITVMSVTSKKTGPPKTHVKVTDRYSQHEEHPKRYHRYSPNYRIDFRDGPANRNRHGSRNRSRSYENDRGNDWEKSRDYEPRGRNYFDASREYNDKPSSRLSDNFRSRNDYGDKMRDNNRSYNDGKFRDKHDRNDRNRFDGGSSDRPGRHNDFDRNNRFDRNDDRIRRSNERSTYRGREFNRGKDFNEFARDDRPRDRFRESDYHRDHEDRFSENNIEKRFESADISGKHRDENSEISKPRTRNQDRNNSISDTVNTSNHVEEVVNKPATQIPVTAVSKEKRREELLNQLKAVEDAIAKKKAKIDK